MFLMNYFSLLVGTHNIVVNFYQKEILLFFFFFFSLKEVCSKSETANLGSSGLLRADRISCKSCFYKSCFLSGF